MLKEIHIIATPIGNMKDMTLRSLETLKGASVILVEEYKVGKKLLDLLSISFKDKELIELNEHNEKQEADALAKQLLKQKGIVCLISDAGSPMIADPGKHLMDRLRFYGVRSVYYPGASSIIGALITSGMNSSDFYYAGFLSKTEKDRQYDLKRLLQYKTTLVIMETPYRLQGILGSVKKVFGEKKYVTLCFAMTSDKEEVFEGTVKDAMKKYEDKNKKPFVLLIDNR